MRKIDFEATGQAIRERRIELGLTQAEAGARIGIKRSYWCQLEHLDGDVKLSTLRRVGEALEMDDWCELVKERGVSGEYSLESVRDCISSMSEEGGDEQ